MKNWWEVFNLILDLKEGKIYIGWFWVIYFAISSYPVIRDLVIYLYEL